jgi:tetratricopeptide (TPR) repeat protein
MTRLQIGFIGSAIALTLGMYAGCETVPRTFKDLEKSRSFSIEQTDITVLLAEAKEKLSAESAAALEEIERSLAQNSSDERSKTKVLEQLSGQWFEEGEYAISGYYAQQIAETLKTGESWGIAGATYAIGIQRSEAEKTKAYCAGRAVQAFENAVSLEPEELSHKINLALIYTDRPPQDNPMKGILMLVDLDKTFPNQPGILFHLGRLALRTGQYEKAIARLETVTALDPERTEAFCLLAQAYSETGEEAKSAAAQTRCETNISPKEGVQ